MFGIERLLVGLRELGHNAVEIRASDGTPFAMISPYEIAVGRFADRSIELALQAMPDFPNSVASAIHVRANPQLYTIGENGNGARNITTSILGGDWAYWSNNFGWNSERSVRRLMSQVNGIFYRAT